MVSDDRAQLILVGAIAIGIVLIALTTVLNSAVFTENVAGGSDAEVTGDVQEFDRESVRNVRSLLVRVNHRRAYRDTGPGIDALEADAARNVTSYSAVLAETYADTGSVYVNVSYNRTVVVGNRLVQREDANFSDDSGPSTWTPLNGPFELGWFVVNLDVENVTQTSQSHVSIKNTSGAELNVSMRRTASNELLVNSTVDGSHTSNVTCDAQNGRVLLDVAEGTSYSGDCTFNSTAYLGGPYANISMVNGEGAHGKYDIVVNETSSPYPVANSCDAGASPERPCKAVAVWSVEFDAHYETGRITYEKTHNVSVYEG